MMIIRGIAQTLVIIGMAFVVVSSFDWWGAPLAFTAAFSLGVCVGATHRSREHWIQTGQWRWEP